MIPCNVGASSPRAACATATRLAGPNWSLWAGIDVPSLTAAVTRHAVTRFRSGLAMTPEVMIERTTSAAAVQVRGNLHSSQGSGGAKQGATGWKSCFQAGSLGVGTLPSKDDVHRFGPLRDHGTQLLPVDPLRGGGAAVTNYSCDDLDRDPVVR